MTKHGVSVTVVAGTIAERRMSEQQCASRVSPWSAALPARGEHPRFDRLALPFCLGVSGSMPKTTRRATALSGGVLMYAHKSIEYAEAKRLAEVADGIVVLGSTGAGLARRLRTGGYSGTVLHDPVEYENDPNRPRAASLFGLEDDTVNLQADLRVTAYLSPSAYVAGGDTRQLDQVLADGVTFCQLAGKRQHRAPAYMVLPLATAWLSKRLYPTLRASLSGVTERIALMVADPGDPLGSAAAVGNLVDLLRARPTTSMLRTDASGLGALAWGSGFVAVGTTPTVRHFAGWGKKGFAKVADPSPRVLCRTVLYYVRGSRLAAADGDQRLLDCRCGVCNGLSLRRLSEPIDDPTGREHSAAVLAEIAAWLRSLPPRDRPAAWRDECARALSDAATLEGLTGAIFDPPAALKAWSRLP